MWCMVDVRHQFNGGRKGRRKKIRTLDTRPLANLHPTGQRRIMNSAKIIKCLFLRLQRTCIGLVSVRPSVCLSVPIFCLMRATIKSLLGGIEFIKNTFLNVDAACIFKLAVIIGLYIKFTSRSFSCGSPFSVAIELFIRVCFVGLFFVSHLARSVSVCLSLCMFGCL